MDSVVIFVISGCNGVVLGKVVVVMINCYRLWNRIVCSVGDMYCIVIGIKIFDIKVVVIGGNIIGSRVIYDYLIRCLIIVDWNIDWVFCYIYSIIWC